MGCKGIKSELISTLFDCYVRNPTQKATPFSCDYLRNQIKTRLIMTYYSITGRSLQNLPLYQLYTLNTQSESVCFNNIQ